MNREQTLSFRHYFNNFALLNLVFLCLQTFYILSLGGNFLQALPLPFGVYVEILETAIIHIFLYGVVSIIQAFILWGITTKNTSHQGLNQKQLVIYTLTIGFIISLNCYFFPLSAFSKLFLPETPDLLIKIILGLCGFGILLITILVLWKSLRQKPFWSLSLLCFISFWLIILFLIPHPQNLQAPSQVKERPNIIIIGVDSLSPERINSKDTPALFQFMNSSVQFTETISPLARTYPAWASILTGLYPIHHQARENLVPLNRVKSSASFVWSLRKSGYYTVFATDDRRFNNLDKDFGFEEILGPKIGINEVLLGTFNDFPLSNLLVNFRISHWLFPYNFMNRAAHHTYYPATFDKALERMLAKNRDKQPLLLAVHFTLPHWPYAWAASSPAEVGDEYSVEERNELYHAAVRQADKQVGVLLKNLQNNDLLKNSLIIVLSDHGEALYDDVARKTNETNYQGNKPGQLADYFTRKTSTTLQKSAGHGSDLLSPAQYHCLLGFTIRKNNQFITPVKQISTRVALIDIAPTIYAFTKLPTLKNPDGISLFSTLVNQSTPPANRLFILESGMLPNQFISRTKAIEYGKLLFQVNPDNFHLELRPDKLNDINSMKLYGILQGDWLLTLYPDDKQYITVILRLSDNRWTDDLNSTFAKSSPIESMLQQLRQFYQEELLTYPDTKLKH